jgi:hypothetical protein
MLVVSSMEYSMHMRFENDKAVSRPGSVFVFGELCELARSDEEKGMTINYRGPLGHTNGGQQGFARWRERVLLRFSRLPLPLAASS